MMSGRGHGNGKPPVAERVRLRKAILAEKEALHRTSLVERERQVELLSQLSGKTPLAFYQIRGVRYREPGGCPA